MDGFPYITFTQKTRTVGASKCILGSSVDPNAMYVDRDEKLILWQIHPDGTYRSTIVDEIKNKQLFSATIYTLSPTRGIVTDNTNGTLIPTRWFDETASGSASEGGSDVVYRVAQDGDVVYKVPMPRYTGALHDDMVIGIIGQDYVAFATRGGALIAFNVTTGKELWRWESNTPEISVFAALANGHCLVQTPTALVEVANSTESKEIAKGKAMIDWHGQMYLQK